MNYYPPPQYYPPHPSQYAMPYPPPHFYPQQESNIGRILLGLGIAAGIGLGAWYIYTHFNGKACSDYSNETDCVANGCYWCNGRCQSTPCNGTACNPLYMGECHSGIEGWQKCDPSSNDLCKCQNGEWICISQDSSICINHITHKECGVNLLGDVICGTYAGDGVDQCGSLGQGCSCTAGNCHDATYCCSDQICRRKAQDTIVVDDLNWTCEQMPWPEYPQLRNQCIYTLPEPLAATKISNGEFFWEWGFWPFQALLTIEAQYNGTWTELWDSGWFWMDSANGSNPVNVVFPGGRCIESLRFRAYSNDRNINVKPASFVGTFSW